MHNNTDKIPLAHVNLRIPQQVLDYYKKEYPAFTKGMRNVLIKEYEKHNK